MIMSRAVTMSSTSFVTWLLFFVISAADGSSSSSSSRSYGPRVKTLDEQCYSRDHCDTAMGQACLWRFEGCDHGQCMCDPSRPFLDSRTGKCVRGLLEGDDCRAAEKRCPYGMDCMKGQCRCTQGKPTKDREACHKSTDRLLGHTCLHGDDCWQKHPSGPGYTQNNVMCVEGKCRCEPGLKEDGQHCHKRRIGDECKQDKHCTGDALCLAGKCSCLQGYRAVAGGTKCAPLRATVDLPLGDPCDEQEQLAFCAAGLVCHRCRSDGPYQCLRPIHQGSAAAYYNNASHHTSYLILVTLCLLSPILVRLRHYR